jgi:hypothetical protein
MAKGDFETNVPFSFTAAGALRFCLLGVKMEASHRHANTAQSRKTPKRAGVRISRDECSSVCVLLFFLARELEKTDKHMAKVTKNR